MSAGHTIYLEELGLKPGDFVSYYAKATDTDAVQGAKTATSDIYFVQIRPFRKDYKPAQSQAMGGGGGGGGGSRSASSRSSSARSSPRRSTWSATRPKIEAGEVPRERGVPQPRAGEAARAGRRAGRQDAQRGSATSTSGSTRSPKLLPKAVAEMKSAEGELKALEGRRARCRPSSAR